MQKNEKFISLNRDFKKIYIWMHEEGEENISIRFATKIFIS